MLDFEKIEGIPEEAKAYLTSADFQDLYKKDVEADLDAKEKSVNDAWKAKVSEFRENNISLTESEKR